MLYKHMQQQIGNTINSSTYKIYFFNLTLKAIKSLKSFKLQKHKQIQG